MQNETQSPKLLCPPALPVEPVGQRYAILETESRAEMAELVNAALSGGWWVHGPTEITVIADSSGQVTRTLFYQAMVRPDWGNALESA